MPKRRLSPAGPFQIDSVVDLAALAAIGGPRPTNGDLIWVSKLPRPFLFDATPGPGVPGQVVPTTDGLGVYRSVNGFSNGASFWTSRTDWHIDAGAGTIEGDGSAAEPLSSWSELVTRIAGQQLGPGTKVTIHGPLSEVVDYSHLIQDPTVGGVLHANWADAPIAVAASLAGVVTP